MDLYDRRYICVFLVGNTFIFIIYLFVYLYFFGDGDNDNETAQYITNKADKKILWYHNFDEWSRS